jgi:hypothetical protein
MESKKKKKKIAEMEISTYMHNVKISTNAFATEQVIASLMLRIHIGLPTEPNAEGHVKEIQWRGFHIPVVQPPAGDGITSQLPLNVRLVTEEDFVQAIRLPSDV